MAETQCKTRALSLTARRIDKIALVMACYILLIIWPTSDLVRLYFAADTAAFSLERFFTALATASGFGLYARWQMKRLITL